MDFYMSLILIHFFITSLSLEMLLDFDMGLSLMFAGLNCLFLASFDFGIRFRISLFVRIVGMIFLGICFDGLKALMPLISGLFCPFASFQFLYNNCETTSQLTKLIRQYYNIVKFIKVHENIGCLKLDFFFFRTSL